MFNVGIVGDVESWVLKLEEKERKNTRKRDTGRRRKGNKNAFQENK
jgi:hypothetical protein